MTENKPYHRTDRSLLAFIVFSIITCGIYGIVVYCKITNEINRAASQHDGKHSMHYLLIVFFTLLTFGIVYFVWAHRLCNRIGNELKRRQIELPFTFNADTFWLWEVLGALIFVGPFFFLHRLLTAMNKINESYNQIG